VQTHKNDRRAKLAALYLLVASSLLIQKAGHGAASSLRPLNRRSGVIQRCVRLPQQGLAVHGQHH
jgi:hypothetical protein